MFFFKLSRRLLIEHSREQRVFPVKSFGVPFFILTR